MIILPIKSFRFLRFWSLSSFGDSLDFVAVLADGLKVRFMIDTAEVERNDVVLMYSEARTAWMFQYAKWILTEQATISFLELAASHAWSLILLHYSLTVRSNC